MKQLSVVLKDTATTTKFLKLENRTKKNTVYINTWYIVTCYVTGLGVSIREWLKILKVLGANVMVENFDDKITASKAEILLT